MKISPITSSQSVNQIQYHKFKTSSREVYGNAVTSPVLYYKPLPEVNFPKTITFLGKTVHIIDGGIHADNMRHFLKAVKSSADI